MERDEIIWQNEVLEMARQAGFHEHDFPFKKFKFEAFAKLVEERTAAKEREACAKICDKYPHGMGLTEKQLAQLIRARGQK